MTDPTDSTPAVSGGNPPPDNQEIRNTDDGSKKEPSSTEAEPSPNSEAARYRVERNDARTERDALAERLSGYQKRECEAAVAKLLDVPADLWEIGQADVTTFYNEDGTVNEVDVQAAAQALIEMRPRLAKPQGPRWQNSGQFSQPPPRQETGWDSVIKG